METQDPVFWGLMNKEKLSFQELKELTLGMIRLAKDSEKDYVFKETMASDSEIILARAAGNFPFELFIEILERIETMQKSVAALKAMGQV